MPDPRLFYLGRHPQELPPGWRNLEADPAASVEIIPGIRVAMTGTGDVALPDGSMGWGATIAVWDERESAAEVEWGIADLASGPRTGRKVRNLGSEDGETVARMLLPDYLKAFGDEAAWLETREIGPWKKVNDEGEPS